MADQKRWFKVWTSILANSQFAEMSLEDIGRWTLLGAATALDGDRGKLQVPGCGKELCRILRVDDLDAAKDALKRIESVLFEEGKRVNGKLTVTWRNWRKYQEDSTAAQRVKTLRSKRRGEEKRGEEREDQSLPNPFPSGKGFVGTRCVYCGATPGQTGRAHEMDHFLPVRAGGTDDPSNRVLACHVCNQAKSGRVFATVEEAREWLHRAYWSSRRARWIKHRQIAFGGKPPAGYQPERSEPTADQVLGLPSGPRRDPGPIDQEALDRALTDHAKRFDEPEGAA